MAEHPEPADHLKEAEKHLRDCAKVDHYMPYWAHRLQDAISELTQYLQTQRHGL